MTVLRDFREIHFSSKNIRTEFHENLTDSLVADIRLQTNGRSGFHLTSTPCLLNETRLNSPSYVVSLCVAIFRNLTLV